jgi:peptidoglycan/LPS O-acetylase OafA/YrhL
MQTTRDSRSQFYRPELDVVRFLAFLLVYLVHTLPSTRDPRVAHLLKGFGPIFDAIAHACGFGLSLFFALSAFLICELLLRERAATGSVAIKQFYIRRILRIWPLYYLGLAIGVAFAFLPGAATTEVAKMGWFAIFLGAWYFVIHGGLRNPAAVLWSVSVEEQFYLIAPWMIKWLGHKSLYGFCLALILVANAWLFYLGRVDASFSTIWANTFVEFECFAAGILLCLVLRGRLPGLAAWQRLALLALGLACWFFACYGFHTFFGIYGGPNPGSWLLIGGWALDASGCVLFLLALLGLDEKFLPGWAIYLGRISFGLYVFHGFAISVTNRLIIGNVVAFNNPFVNKLKGPIYVLNFALAFGLTVAVASLSYRYFETPFLRMKKRHSVIESQPIQGAG